jgi:hypothetical protein
MLSTSQPPKRDRPSLHSFSIRELLLVTVIVALALGWWVNRQQWAGLVQEESDRARLWFLHCGAMERILGKAGYKVEFGESDTLRATSQDGTVYVEDVSP